MNVIAAIPLMIFGVVWIGMITFFDVMTVPPALNQIRTLGFATTEGTVTRSEITTNLESEGGSSYRPAVSYRYEAAGTIWTSDKLYYGGSGTSDRDSVAALIRPFPDGAQVVVHYDPASPGEAVLQTGLRPEHLFIALFMTPFHLVGFGFIAVGFTLARGGAKRTAKPLDEMRMAVRMPWYSPLSVGLAAVGAAAFFSIFVCAFVFGFPPPTLPPIVGVWLTVLALGSYFAWRRHQLLCSGAADLIVDAGAKTVTLPLAAGRKTPVTLLFAGVSEVRVDRVTSCVGETDSVQYHLGLRSGGETYRLHSGGNAAQLNGLAQALSETFGWPLVTGDPTR